MRQEQSDMSSPDILCSRCGTPFPIERGVTAATCVVCGQLRPDLDMMLDDDDEDTADLGPEAGAELRAGVAVGAARSHLVVSPDAPPARPFISMNERRDFDEQNVKTGVSLTQRLGPVLLVMVPLMAGMAGALSMLSLVPNFSKGSWYAVGLVFLLLSIGSLTAGLLVSMLAHALRLRWNLVLRVLFVAAAAFVAYFGVRNVPSHLQVRNNELPGIMFTR